MARKINVEQAITNLAGLRAPTAWADDAYTGLGKTTIAVTALGEFDGEAALKALAEIAAASHHTHKDAVAARNAAILAAKRRGWSFGTIAKATGIERTLVVKIVKNAASPDA